MRATLHHLVGVIMSVVMMAMRPHSRKLRWGGAAMRRLAADRLELNRSVSDMKLIAQRTVDPSKNAAALRHRHLGNRNMTGQRMRLRAKAPDMKIMHVKHTID